MLYQLSYEATRWECGQFIELISPGRSDMMWSIYEIIQPRFQDLFPSWTCASFETQCVMSLRLLVSCGTSASSAENSILFYCQPSPRMKDHGLTWKTGLEHEEETNRIFAFKTFFKGKIAQLLHISVSALRTRRWALGVSDTFLNNIQTYLMMSYIKFTKK